MKTIFGLLSAYPDAEQAVEGLLEHGVSEEEINVIVQERVAKDHLDVDLRQVNVAATDEIGEKRVHGLDAILGTQQPVAVHGEKLFAAGKLANILLATAAASSLESALFDLGVPQDVAKFYDTGIREGAILLWVRVDDESTSLVVGMMQDRGGERVGDYAG